MRVNNILDTSKQMYSTAREAFDKAPESIALSFMGKKITGRELFTEIDKWAEILSRNYGVTKGDVVAMNLPNIPNAIIIFYAINKCGAIANIMHPFLPAKKVVQLMKETKTKLFFAYDVFYEKSQGILDSEFKGHIITASVSDYLPLIKKIVFSKKEPKAPKNVSQYSQIAKNAVAQGIITEPVKFKDCVYMHSAGTSGESKTIVLSNRALNELSKALGPVIPNLDPAYNKCVTVMPLFHGFGFGVCMHTMLSHGFEVILIPKFTPKGMASAVAKRKATICAGVPVLFKKLLDLSDKNFKKLLCLDHIFVGGDKLTAALKEEFDSRVRDLGGQAELTEGYGLTETVTVCCVNEKGETDNTCMGPPLKGIKFQIIDSDGNTISANKKGEICVAGPTLMEGYLGDTKGDVFVNINDERYVKTGDIGYLDEQGKLHFIDRIKRIFKISGITIFPSEIESTIKSIKGIQDCITMLEGKSIYAFVEYSGNDIDLLKEKILVECKQALLPYAIPKEKNIIIVSKFPKTTVGKTDIFELRKLIKF